MPSINETNKIQNKIENQRKSLERYRLIYKDQPVHITGKDPVKILQECLGALEKNPWNKLAFCELGEFADKLENYALAAYSFAEMIKLGDTGQKTRRKSGLAVYRLAKQLEHQKRYNEALAQFEQAGNIFKDYDFSKDPEISQIMNNLETEIKTVKFARGGISDLEKKTGESARLDKEDHGEINLGNLEKDLEDNLLDPAKRIAAGKKISDYFAKRKDYEKAIQYLEKARKVRNDSDIRKDIAELKFIVLGNEPSKESLISIKQEYESLSKDRPNDANVAIVLGKINSQLGDWKECLRVLQSAKVTEHGKKEELELMIGEALLEISQPLAAAKQFNRIAENNPGKYIDAIYGLGKAQEALDKREEAADNFSEVIRIDINYKDALKRLKQLQDRHD